MDGTMRNRVLPLVIILGATGSGKSKLAIELARRFNGEIINADSMQVYKGLDIATNKVTVEERALVKHHLLSSVDPNCLYSVSDFKKDATRIIDNLRKKDALPILVGGTQYYIESILFKNFTMGDVLERNHSEVPVNSLIEKDCDISSKTMMNDEKSRFQELESDMMNHNNSDLEDLDKFFEKPITHESFKEIPSIKLWNILNKVDPDAASLYHMNNKRRIIRSLQIIQEQKRCYSNIIEDMNVIEGQKRLGGPLRYEPTCVIWLNCDKIKLEQIVTARIDEMLQRGLLEELNQFYKLHEIPFEDTKDNRSYSKGIMQAIGFKEFRNYLKLESDMKDKEQGKVLLRESIKAMTFATIQYSKRQIRWITRRLLYRHGESNIRQLPDVYELETCTNSCEWTSKVLDPAFQIIDAYYNNKPLASVQNYRSLPRNLQVTDYRPGKYYCDKCDKIFIGNHSMESHLTSRSHRKSYKRKLLSSR